MNRTPNNIERLLLAICNQIILLITWERGSETERKIAAFRSKPSNCGDSSENNPGDVWKGLCDTLLEPGGKDELAL